MIEQSHNDQQIRIQPEIVKFHEFFTGLESHCLKGIHTMDAHRGTQTCQNINLQKAESIYRNYAFKEKFFSKKNWRHDQISLLVYIVDKACLKCSTSIYEISEEMWKSISNLMPGRRVESCKEKIYSLSPSKLNQTPWTLEEDQLLLNLIEQYGTKEWKAISLELIEKNSVRIYRSSKQCREHYACFLKPNLKKGVWQESEDYELLSLFLKYGRKWSRLSRQLPGRNQNSIKNRFSLLFENRNSVVKQFPSEIMRKVKKKKQMLENKLKKEDHEDQHLQNKTNEEVRSTDELEKVESEGAKALKKELKEVQYEEYFAF